MGLRFGCLPHDPALAAALPPMRLGVESLPQTIPHPDWTPEMWDNDTVPNCTVCALGNSARAWESKWHPGGDIAIPTGAINTLYGRVIGQPGADPAVLAQSDGTDPMQVVQWAQGAGWDIGGQVPLVPGFEIAGNGVLAMAQGVHRAGAVMCALTLFAGDMAAFEGGRPWISGGDPGGVAGGHMTALAGFDGTNPDAFGWMATWGRWQPASWSWILARLRLVIVASWPQLAGPT